MKSIYFLLICVVLCASRISLAAPMNASLGHIYWGLGPNWTPTGNFRLGIGSVEFGLVQSTGFGVVLVQRSATPLFIQLGLITDGVATGVIGGGGLEWNNSSWFRFRTDLTVSLDSQYQTKSILSFGGVFVL